MSERLTASNLHVLSARAQIADSNKSGAVKNQRTLDRALYKVNRSKDPTPASSRLAFVTTNDVHRQSSNHKQEATLKLSNAGSQADGKRNFMTSLGDHQKKQDAGELSAKMTAACSNTSSRHHRLSA